MARNYIILSIKQHHATNIIWLLIDELQVRTSRAAGNGLFSAFIASSLAYTSNGHLVSVFAASMTFSAVVFYIHVSVWAAHSQLPFSLTSTCTGFPPHGAKWILHHWSPENEVFSPSRSMSMRSGSALLQIYVVRLLVLTPRSAYSCSFGASGLVGCSVYSLESSFRSAIAFSFTSLRAKL